MKTCSHLYFIRVSVPSETVPFSFFYLAEHNELALSFNRRLCSIFHKNMAVFETEKQAQEFLDGVKLKTYWEYLIDECWKSS